VEQLNQISEDYKQELLKSIPVVAAMDVSIGEIKESGLVLHAPLNTNINYEGTAFGGSLNTLGILSCYLFVHHVMKQRQLSCKSLVIQDSQISYLKPVSGDFCARSEFLNLDSFLRMMERKGTGRAELTSKIFLSRDGMQDEELVHFQGRFVASM